MTHSFLLLFLCSTFLSQFVSAYTCTNWLTVNGCNNFESSFWAQTFTDNTPTILAFDSFSKITVEGLYGGYTTIDSHCITSNEGITIDRSLIRRYLAGDYTDILQYSTGNFISEHSGSSTTFIDIPSSFTFTSPCIVHQNYGTTNISMNHAIILKYGVGGNGEICIDNGDILSFGGVISGDLLANCTTYDFEYDEDMHFTFDSYNLLYGTHSPTTPSYYPTSSPTTVAPTSRQYLGCSEGICTCSGGEACTIYCADTYDCYDSVLTCNSGYDCVIYCSNSNACNLATIEANDATSLTVICQNGEDACRSTTVNCQSTTLSCDLDCKDDGHSRMCRSTTITCGTGECSIDCTGDGSNVCQYINIDATLSSSYSCSNYGANEAWCSLADVETSTPTTNPPTVPTIPTTSSPTTISPTTDNPTTSMPSIAPSMKPSSLPTVLPSLIPTTFPTLYPSIYPTLIPTFNPTFNPSSMPPTLNPTSISPTSNPTAMPSQLPSVFPSVEPTTSAPSDEPTTNVPSDEPSALPSLSPSTHSPTHSPSIPSYSPSASTYPPTQSPSIMPSVTSEETNNQPSNNNSIELMQFAVWILIVGCVLICCIIIGCLIAYFRMRKQSLRKEITLANMNIASLSDIPSSHINKSMNANFDNESILNTNLTTNLTTISIEEIPSDIEEDALHYLSAVNIASRGGNRRKMNSIVEDRNEDDEKRSRLETDLISLQTTKGNDSSSNDSTTHSTPDKDIIVVVTDDGSVEEIVNDADIENIHIVDGIVFVADCSQIPTTTDSVNNQENDNICPPVVFVETRGSVTVGAEDEESTESESSSASESSVDVEEGDFQDMVNTPIGN